MAGSNAFYINKNSNYAEAFVGLENIFKIVRVDFVTAFSNGNHSTTGLRIGFGGIIGGSVRRTGNGGMSISL